MFKRKNVSLDVFANTAYPRHWDDLMVGYQQYKIGGFESMTLLQDAEKQLHDALKALESAVRLAAQANSEAVSQKNTGDMSVLAGEVAVIESTLDEAMQLIAKANASSIGGTGQ